MRKYSPIDDQGREKLIFKHKPLSGLLINNFQEDRTRKKGKSSEAMGDLESVGPAFSRDMININSKHQSQAKTNFKQQSEKKQSKKSTIQNSVQKRKNKEYLETP